LDHYGSSVFGEQFAKLSYFDGILTLNAELPLIENSFTWLGSAGGLADSIIA
jgi:hypothetical protein